MARVAEQQLETEQALEAAIAAQALPRSARAQASTLLDRMHKTTRVTLLGQPGSGKSAIVNLLAGQDIIPLDLQLCTMQLVYGPAFKSVVTLRDGSNLTMDETTDIQQISAMTPVFLKIEAPLPALKKISVLEVVTSGERVEQIRALAWAAKQTDIAIWCTSDYDTAEQTLWSDIPDTIKDHAILVRTRADILGSEKDAVISQLTRHAGPDFSTVLAVSASQAAAARDNPHGLDKDGMKASGATRLISTILRQIEQGRQYAVDQAEILLHKHKDYVPDCSDTESVETRKEQAVSQPVTPQPAPEPVVEPEVAVEPINDGIFQAAPEKEAVTSDETIELVDKSEVNEADPVIEDAISVESAPEANVTETVEDTADASLKIFEEAAARLQKTGQDLAETDDLTPKVVLNRAADDIVWLSDHLLDADVSSSESLSQLSASVRDAEDLIQLLRIEGGDDSATDAVTALLQLKRSFQAQTAA